MLFWFWKSNLLALLSYWLSYSGFLSAITNSSTQTFVKPERFPAVFLYWWLYNHTLKTHLYESGSWMWAKIQRQIVVLRFKHIHHFYYCIFGQLFDLHILSHHVVLEYAYTVTNNGCVMIFCRFSSHVRIKMNWRPR